MSNHLAERAMLASIKISMWRARILDRKVTDETNRRHGADPDAGRYNKLLLPKHALAEMDEIAGEARRFFYANTWAWTDNGMRVLASTRYDHFTAGFRKLETRFVEARDQRFVPAYPEFREFMRGKLNGMFNEADYPSVQAIRSKFELSRRVFPMPDVADFRIDISAGERERMAAQIAADIQASMREAQRDCYARLAEKVGHMAEKLAAFKPAERKGEKTEGIFRDSLVENVRELASMLPAFANDPAMSALTARVEALCQHDADTLRQNATIRAETATIAAEIASHVSDFI